MSDVQAENEQLKKQMQSNQKGVQGLLDQLDGHKSMINDNIVQNLNLRTQCVSFQKQLKTAQEEIESLKKKLADLEKSSAASVSVAVE